MNIRKVYISLVVMLLCAAPILAEEVLTSAKWLEKAKEYQAKGDYYNAIDAYSQAVKLDGNKEDALTERGKLYLQLKQYDLALADFTEGTKIKPQSADLYWLKGIANAGKGNHFRAVAEYNKTLRIDPKVYMAYWCLALSYERLGSPEYAIQEYSTFIKKAPADYPNIKEAKDRLAQLTAWDKARIDALDQAALPVQPKYVFKFLDSDTIALNFKDRPWKIGFQQVTNNQLMVELVPMEQTVANWNQLITVQFDTKLRNTSPEQFAEFIKKHNVESYEDRATVQILRVSPSEALIEYKVVGQPGITDEHTVTRVIKGNDCLILLHYAAKPSMTEEQRKFGLEILDSVVPTP